jgi:hypothetical protein
VWLLRSDIQKQAAHAALLSFFKSELEIVDRNLAGLKDIIALYPEMCNGHELRAEASYIHDFYNSAENIFRQVAEQLNGGIPRGDAWHKLLLLEMKDAIPGEREAVISNNLFAKLEQILRFRHLVRNSYGVLLDPQKTREIALLVLDARRQLHDEFLKFLARLC